MSQSTSYTLPAQTAGDSETRTAILKMQEAYDRVAAGEGPAPDLPPLGQDSVHEEWVRVYGAAAVS